MTSVVGILNKQAVALAADSAVTISGIGNRKVLNNANKIFTLSKYHPVAVMLYNSATFLGTPWETIIKMYRKQLGNTSFATLKEYQEDFIRFLHAQNLFSDEALQRKFLLRFFKHALDAVIGETLAGNKNLLSNYSEESMISILSLIEQRIDLRISQLKELVCDEFTDLDYPGFAAFCDIQLTEAIDQTFIKYDFDHGENLLSKIRDFLYHLLRSKEKKSDYTGLVFAGFGERELYPQLIPINVSLAFQERLRFFVETGKMAAITHDRQSAIRPFAQTDVINTIISGIDPTLDLIYLENFKEFLGRYNKEILSTLDGYPHLASQIQEWNIRQLIDDYAKSNGEARRINYITPLMNAIGTLSKEDLAEMAESLIYLTYLKKRITLAEETVGGPVDVAIITKGDGFIWIKRKHYFKPELNRHFFDNYFNH